MTTILINTTTIILCKVFGLFRDKKGDCKQRSFLEPIGIPWRGKRSKTPVMEKFRYTPFLQTKNLLKIGPKIVFFGRKTLFSASRFTLRGGDPFPLRNFCNFLAGRIPLRGREGYPLSGIFPWLGRLNTSLTRSTGVWADTGHDPRGVYSPLFKYIHIY